MWVYNDDLPEEFDYENNIIDAVRVSSIVEGSEVEVPAIVLDEYTDSRDLLRDFSLALTRVDLDACMYWARDNDDKDYLEAILRRFVFAVENFEDLDFIYNEAKDYLDEK